MTVFEILEELESDNSRLAKEAVLRREVGNDLLRRTFAAELDPYRNYYVTKFTRQEPGHLGGDAALESFLSLLDQLSARVVTGNAARSAVERLFNGIDAQAQAWCERLLLRNLRVGASDKLINKTWPGTVKRFAVALAESQPSRIVDGVLVLDEPIAYPVIVEPKLDGLRCVAVKESGKVTLWTRNGTEIDSPGTQHIRTALEKHPLDNIVFDGEILSNGNWNDTITSVMKGRTIK